MRECIVTPLKWHPPAAENIGRYLAVLYDCFPDMVEFTVGHARLVVKLQVFESEPLERVNARCRQAQARLFGLWTQDSREQALEEGSLETIREKTIAMIADEHKQGGPTHEEKPPENPNPC